MPREYEDYTGGGRYTDRSSDSVREIQEMEQIEKGLQDFLKQEMEMKTDTADSKSRKGYDEDWDSPPKHQTAAEARSNANRSRSAQSNKKSNNNTKNSRRATTQNTTNKRQKNKNDRNNGNNKKKKKKSGFRRFAAVLLIIILIIAAAWYYIVGAVYSKLNYEKIESVASESMKDEGVINILLIGNDSRENGGDGRSDAMILVSINPKSKTIYMTSILRDIYVDIPGHDGNRLNAAYSYGGAELLMKTIENNFDIEVNRYVLVNFEAFANLVDAVGGVDLELSNAEVEYVNAYLWEYNILTERPEGTDYMDTSLSGMIHLNGPQALAYSRNRYIGTDFGRTERQRKVLSAVIKKLPKAVVTNPTELIEGLFPNLTTNLTKGECYRLSFTAAQLLSYEIVQGSIPIEGTYKDATIRKMAVLEVDFDANKKYIQDNIYSNGKVEEE
jgi:LCP family protein required for cell wall assembly